jgi:hypothetical protein
MADRMMNKTTTARTIAKIVSTMRFEEGSSVFMGGGVGRGGAGG